MVNGVRFRAPEAAHFRLPAAETGPATQAAEQPPLEPARAPIDESHAVEQPDAVRLYEDFR